MGTDRKEARDERGAGPGSPALLSDPSPLTESLEQAIITRVQMAQVLLLHIWNTITIGERNIVDLEL